MAGTALPGSGKVHQESRVTTFNGFAWLAIGLAFLAWAIYVIGGAIVTATTRGAPGLWPFVAGALIFVAAAFVLGGLYTLQPNEAAIMQLFGAYKGTTRVPGLRGTNPFYTRKKISLRARNLNGERLKVNDKRGNPIDIAAVVVWRVDDTAARISTSTTTSSTSSCRPKPPCGISPRPSPTTRTTATRSTTANRRCSPVADSWPRRWSASCRRASTRRAWSSRRRRLTHLAYAPEIAQVMLRRQQADAIIAARSKIVTGAVSMVEMALNELSAKKDRGPRRRAQGRHGQQPDDRAVLGIRRTAGDQYRHALQLTKGLR